MALPAPVKPSLGSKQTIQARHGVATFVPQGFTIKIINTYGKQVVDTWAFALSTPPEDSEIEKGDKAEKNDKDANKAASNTDLKEGKAADDGTESKGADEGEAGEKRGLADDERENVIETETKENKNAEAEGESNEKDEEDVAEGEKNAETKDEDKAEPVQQPEKTEHMEAKNSTKKSGWGAYIPSLSRGKAASNKKTQQKPTEGSDDEKMSKSWSSYLMGSGSKDGSSSNTNSQKKGWSSYIPSGQGFSSYIPTKDTLSAFASSQYRDPTKSYAEQLYDFSKTPVGAASLSLATGSGYAGSLYAAYKAYDQFAADSNQPAMEYLSMMHTRASTLHLSPRVGDTLVSNLRAPLLTVLEDTSPGVHDTLIAACDPQRYKELGVEKWEEHGSCAENCVLALKEINEKSGLKGKKAIGSDVTVNTVPAPLNLFMNIPWTDDGDISFEEPKTKRGDYIKFRAERDVVVVMSACPQDVLAINGHKPMVAHFVVESSSPEDLEAAKRKEEEAASILEKARRRTSGQKVPKAEPKPAQQSAPAAEDASTENPRDAAQSKAPATKAPKAGKKAPRKLERRSNSTQSPAPATAKT